ncbi:MAG: hypothetical protein ACP5OZ_02375 [Candidatus Woesearchaeota archaeon]
MVVYREGLTRIIEEELFENPETAENYKERIMEFRKRGYRAVYDVAIFLKEIVEKKYDKSKVSPTINSNIISKIIFNDSREHHTKNILKIIEREYGSMLDFLEKENFLEYNFDFYDNLKRQGLKYSISDVRRQIIVPEKLKNIDYFLLGAVAGDGRLDKIGEEICLVILQGEKSDYDFYAKVLRKIISERFNISAELMNFEKHGVRIDLSSRIIYSWVEKFLNFPKNKKNLEFKINADEDCKIAFLSGLIETTAKIERTGLVLEHRHKKLILSTGNLLSSMKIDYCYGERILDTHKPYNIIIPKNQVLSISKKIMKQEFFKKYNYSERYAENSLCFLNEKFLGKLKEYKFR